MLRQQWRFIALRKRQKSQCLALAKSDKLQKYGEELAHGENACATALVGACLWRAGSGAAMIQVNLWLWNEEKELGTGRRRDQVRSGAGFW